MDYKRVKENITQIKKDLKKSPLQTFLIILVVLIMLGTAFSINIQSSSQKIVGNNNVQGNNNDIDYNYYDSATSSIVFQEQLIKDKQEGNLYKQKFRVLVTISKIEPVLTLLVGNYPIKIVRIGEIEKNLLIFGGNGEIKPGQYWEYSISFLTDMRIEERAIIIGIK